MRERQQLWSRACVHTLHANCQLLFILGLYIIAPKMQWKSGKHTPSAALKSEVYCPRLKVEFKQLLSFLKESGQSCTTSGLRKLKFLKTLFNRNSNRSFPFWKSPNFIVEPEIRRKLKSFFYNSIQRLSPISCSPLSPIPCIWGEIKLCFITSSRILKRSKNFLRSLSQTFDVLKDFRFSLLWSTQFVTNYYFLFENISRWQIIVQISWVGHIFFSTLI